MSLLLDLHHDAVLAIEGSFAATNGDAFLDIRDVLERDGDAFALAHNSALELVDRRDPADRADQVLLLACHVEPAGRALRHRLEHIEHLRCTDLVLHQAVRSEYDLHHFGVATDWHDLGDAGQAEQAPPDEPFCRVA